MKDNKKLQDKRLWQQLGHELAALQVLLPAIACDYYDLFDDKAIRKLVRMGDHLLDVRSAMESKMSQHVSDWSTEAFYPTRRTALDAACEDFRKILKEEQ